MRTLFSRAKRPLALFLTLMLLLSGAQLGLVSQASAADGAEENTLFAKWVEWNDDDLLIESEDTVFDGTRLTMGGSTRLSFYFGTEDNAVRVPLDELSGTNGVEITDFTNRADQLQNSEDLAYFARVNGTEFGTGTVLYTYDGLEYSFTIETVLGLSDFFSSPVYGEDNYIDSFTVTEENNSFYFIYSISRGWHIGNIEMSEDFDAIADFEYGTCDDGSSYVKFTVTGQPEDGYYYDFYCTMLDENGNEVDSSYESIRLYNGIPHLMYRHMEWDNNQQIWYENTNNEMSSQWNTSPGYSSIVKFYYGTEESKVSVELEDLSISGKGITLNNEDGYARMEAVAFGEYNVIYTDADGNKHTMPITVDLPDLGFYTAPSATKANYINTDNGFTVTESNDTFYLIPLDGILNSVTLDDDFAEIASVEIATDNSYASITVTGSPEGYYYGMRASFTRTGSSRANTWGLSLRLKDGNPYLMYRHMEWDSENQCYYENTDNSLNNSWEMWPGYSSIVKFYYGTEESKVAVELEDLSVSGNGISLENEDGFVRVEATAFGDYEIVYASEHAMPVTVDLPDLGFYTAPSATQANFINPSNGFTVTESNDTFYLIPLDGTMNSVTLYDDFAEIATVEIAADNSYASITVTGSPEGYYYGLRASFTRTGNSRASTWGWSLRLKDGTPHLMYRHLDWDSENQCYYENTDNSLNNSWEMWPGYSSIVKFYYGTEESKVAVELEDLSVSGNGISLENEDGFVRVEAAAFGDYEIVYAGEHAMPVTVDLPDLGFYTAPSATQANFINPSNGFTVTESNDTFYLIPLDGTMNSVTLYDDFAEIATVEIAADNSYASITVTGSPEGYYYGLRASFTRTGNSRASTWGWSLRLKDGTPHLMYRYLDWDSENQCYYENTEYALNNRFETSPGNGSIVKFYYGTEESKLVVEQEDLSVSGTGISLGDFDGFVLIEALDFGDYEIIYTDEDGNEHTMPATVELPDLGFYTAPSATQDNYINASDGFTVSESNDTFYLIPLDGTMNSVTLNDSFAEIASVEIADDNSYASITVTGTPEGSHYGLRASFTRTGSSYINTWGMGLRLLVALPDGYEQMYSYNADGRYVRQPTGGSTWTNLYIDDENGERIQLDNSYTLSCSDDLGSIFWQEDGSVRWVSENAIPYSVGYLFATKDNAKYAIVAYTTGPDACVYTEIPTSGKDTSHYVPSNTDGSYPIEYTPGTAETRYICFGLEDFAFDWTLNDSFTPISSNSNVTVSVVNENILAVTLPASASGANSTDIVFELIDEDGEAFQMIFRLDFYTNTLAAPTIKVTTSASSGKPYISWTAVEGATGYEVYRSDSKNGTYTKLITTKASKLNVTHTGAELGNDYFYKVRAISGDTKGEFSAIKGVWCDLARPTVTVTNRASDGKPVISWTAVEGATGYKVYYCGTSGGTYKLLYTAAATKLSVTHTGAAVGNDYFYKVKAIYSDNSSCDSALTAAKGVWVDLKRPTIKVVNSASSGKPVISWGKVDYAVGYKVYCATGSSTGTYKLIYSTSNPDKLSVTHIGAKAGEAYFYKVVAVHKNSKCTSAYSTAKGVYCDLARPTLTVDLNSKGKPYLSWTESAGADSYKVYRSTDNSTWTLLYTAKGDDFDVTHTGAKADTTYYYKVVAICGTTSKGNSAYSTVQSITVE